MFAVVPQKAVLFKGTVRSNLLFGKDDATDEELLDALSKAQALDFVNDMENKLDATVEQNGRNLSAGQRQLLCIARIMLCLPPMLILDEATSSIDTRTELKIQDAFNKLMKGRTSFIVAHRLSTIRDADLILVMRDGKVIETGSHTELLSKKGFYYNLYNSQYESTEE